MQEFSVLIAGAGIGGLAAALALLRKSFKVQVFEQAPELGEVGAGLQMAPNGTRLLRELGLEAALESSICEASSKEVRLWSTGETRKLFDLGEDSRRRFDAPFWFVHRGDLHRALLQAVRALAPDSVYTGKLCVSYAQDVSGVELAFDDGSKARGSVLVCADGVHSRMRGQMIQSAQAEFTGIVAWRGMAPTSRLPEELRRPIGTNWVGPGGHIVTYPLRGGSVLNFAGFVERSDWSVESWSVTGTREECSADFHGWNESVHEIVRHFDQPFKWALIGRDPLKTWTDGRVALLGDAAHATLPFLGQGAIMALEDAVVLARCLEETTDQPELALQRYEDSRIDRTTAVVTGSAENAKRFHNPVLADPDSARFYLDTQWAPEKVRLRYDWLFEYDATSVRLAPIRETVA